MSEIKKPTILRCSYSDEAPWLPKEKCALICEEGLSLIDGYGAYLVSEEVKTQYPDDPLVFVMPEDCEAGEFLRLDYENVTNMTRLVTADLSERTLFLTGRCNSNCIMCPYSTRQRLNGQPSEVGELLQYIELMNPEAEYLCITGGEPTLLKEGFLTVLSAVKAHFQYALVHILTNGRTFYYRDFYEAYQTARPYETLLGIPLHASTELLHDKIAGVLGSFRQTIKGLDRCYAGGEHIEIRIVTSALNIHNLRDLALFIAARYPAVSHVSLMGLEMMGNAMLNRQDVWVGYDTLMPEVEAVADILLSHGVSVRLFNYPLCKVGHKYHTIYYRSISEYKIRYKPECDDCTKQSECGGFFQTTIAMPDITVQPFH